MEVLHRPVLVKEVVEYLIVEPAGIYVDGTVGTGGHSLAIDDRLSPEGRIICLDRDPGALTIAKRRLAALGKRLILLRENYSNLDRVLMESGVKKVNGVLLDLGMSSLQLEASGRGFSFSKEEPLDMRMDPDSPVTAAQLVNGLPARDLETILRRFGEEKRARPIAAAISRARKRASIETSARLAAVVKSVFPPPRRSGTVHPATRTFQALRIAVNKELEHLNVFLDKIPSLLGPGGRLCILTYHSLEDRPVKRALSGWEKGCTCPPDFPECVCGKVPLFKRLSKKALRPNHSEIAENPRARSARLRVAERIAS